MVESIDPRHTGEDIIQTIKSKIEVASLGVGVSGVRKCKNSKVATSVTSEKERKRSAIENLRDRFSVSTLGARKPLLRLIGVTPDLENAKVEEALHKQNVGLLAGLFKEQGSLRVVRMTKGRNRAVSNIIIEVTSQLWNRLRDARF